MTIIVCTDDNLLNGIMYLIGPVSFTWRSGDTYYRNDP